MRFVSYFPISLLSHLTCFLAGSLPLPPSSRLQGSPVRRLLFLSPAILPLCLRLLLIRPAYSPALLLRPPLLRSAHPPAPLHPSLRLLFSLPLLGNRESFPPSEIFLLYPLSGRNLLCDDFPSFLLWRIKSDSLLLFLSSRFFPSHSSSEEILRSTVSLSRFTSASSKGFDAFNEQLRRFRAEADRWVERSLDEHVLLLPSPAPYPCLAGLSPPTTPSCPVSLLLQPHHRQALRVPPRQGDDEEPLPSHQVQAPNGCQPGFLQQRRR